MTIDEMIQWLSDAAARAITQAGPLATCPLREYAGNLMAVENELRQMKELRKVAYMAQRVLEEWASPRDLGIDAEWPVKFVGPHLVFYCIPPRLKSGGRSAKLIACERSMLGPAHNYVIRKLRELNIVNEFTPDEQKRMGRWLP
jgi:hypothetical protein